jgi:hypothetical protein
MLARTLELPESSSLQVDLTTSREKRRTHRGGTARNLVLPTAIAKSSQQLQEMCMCAANLETYEVCVPHPDSILYTYLPHQQTVHPPEAELHIFNAFILEVLGKTCVYPGCKITQSAHLPVDPRLGIYVVILNAIQQL